MATTVNMAKNQFYDPADCISAVFSVTVSKAAKAGQIVYLEEEGWNDTKTLPLSWGILLEPLAETGNARVMTAGKAFFLGLKEVNSSIELIDLEKLDGKIAVFNDQEGKYAN